MWKTQDSSIILFLSGAYYLPVNRNFYVGILVLNDIETKVAVSFDSRNFGIGIIDNNMLQRDNIVNDSMSILVGSLKIREDKLYLSVVRGRYTDCFPTEIIFHRLEYYDPIDPYDWVISQE